MTVALNPTANHTSAGPVMVMVTKPLSPLIVMRKSTKLLACPLAESGAKLEVPLPQAVGDEVKVLKVATTLLLVDRKKQPGGPEAEEIVVLRVITKSGLREATALKQSSIRSTGLLQLPAVWLACCGGPRTIRVVHGHSIRPE